MRNTESAAGKQQATVTFSIDADGILSVTAISKSNSSAKNKITIENVCGSLTKAEIEKMIADAERYGQADRELKECHAARSELEQYCYEIRGTHRSVDKKCNEILFWLTASCRPNITRMVQMRDELKTLASALRKLKRENETETMAVTEHSSLLKVVKVEKANDSIEVEVKAFRGQSENESDDDVKIILPNENDLICVIDD